MTAGRRARVRSMRAGLFLAYWPWFTPEEQVELAVLADEIGLDSVSVSDASVQDAVSALGIDTIALATTPDALPERLAAFETVGVDTLLAVPCGSDRRPRVARALAEAL